MCGVVRSLTRLAKRLDTENILTKATSANTGETSTATATRTATSTAATAFLLGWGLNVHLYRVQTPITSKLEILDSPAAVVHSPRMAVEVRIPVHRMLGEVVDCAVG